MCTEHAVNIPACEVRRGDVYSLNDMSQPEASTKPDNAGKSRYRVELQQLHGLLQKHAENLNRGCA